MRTDKEAAIKLRLRGHSYNQITNQLKIPKSTLSGWLKDIVLNQNTRDKIQERSHTLSREGLLRHNKRQTTLAKERARATQQSAADIVPQLDNNALLFIGAALYWAEGYKKLQVRNNKEITSHRVSLTNSDPILVKAFIKFLIEYCHVEKSKIKAELRLFAHLNEEFVTNFWHQQTGIPRENFAKAYYGISRSSQGKRPFNRLPHGIIQITVASTPLFYEIMGYIEGIKKFV